MSIDNIAQTLVAQYAALEQRKQNPTDSYSSKLLQDPNKILKKAGEEFAEMIAAYAKGDIKGFLGEAQQNIWLIQMMAVDLGIPQDPFFKALEYT